MKNIVVIVGISLATLSSVAPLSATDLNLGAAASLTAAPVNALVTLDNSTSMLQEYNFNYRWDYSSYISYTANPRVQEFDLNLSKLGMSAGSCGTNHNFTYVWGSTAYLNGLSIAPDRCRYRPMRDNPLLAFVDWRLISHDGNSLYYNPARTYVPWTGMPAADFRAVRENPDPAHADYSVVRDLATDTTIDGASFKFAVWQDSAGSSATWAPTPQSYQTGANGEVDLWDSHTLYEVSAGAIMVRDITFNPVAVRLSAAQIGSCNFNSDPRAAYSNCLGRSVSSRAFTNPFGRNVAEEQQNIANWFQYHRNRAFEARYAIYNIINSFPDIQYGIASLGDQNQAGRLFVPIRDSSVDAATHNAELIDQLLHYWGMGLTYLGESSIFAGEYFKGNIPGLASPITQACEQNFHILVTDGDRNSDWNASIAGIVDHDGDGHSFADNSAAVSLGDIASYYYMNDLALSVPNESVQIQTYCDGARQVDHQGLSFVGLAYGDLASREEKLNPGCWPDGDLAENDDWGNPFPSSGSNFPSGAGYRDLWHAAFNSNGYFSFFKDSQGLIDELATYFGSLETETAFNSQSAISTNELTEQSLFFTASFDLATNTGGLKALKPNLDTGNDSFTALWTITGTQALPLNTIFSYDSDNDRGIKLSNDAAGVGALTAGQYAVLFPTGDAASKNTNLSAFLANLYDDPLGPVVNSNVVFVGNPTLKPQYTGRTINRDIFGDSFTDFVTTTDREPMVYVNSNNGRLYGFNAQTGAPTVTYLPNAVLTDRFTQRNNAGAQTFLDGEIFVGDAFLKERNKWASILIGSMRYGGQGFYALDITAPNQFNASKVLWEFTDQDDADMGFSYAKPAIGYMGGRWVAVLANGYNNTSISDARPSTTGVGALFIVDLETGQLLKKFTSKARQNSDPSNQARPNGFAEPSIIDNDQDGTIDSIYVGDFYGNLYAFDVSGDDPDTWTSFFGAANNADPMVPGKVVNNLPIIIRPLVTFEPVSNRLLIMYGSGENITDAVYGDNHRLIGVYHQDSPVSGSVDLDQRTLVNATGNRWQIQAPATDQTPSPNGWMLDLSGSAAGFRSILKPRLHFGELIWVLNQPQGLAATSCSNATESSLLLAFDPFTGTSLPYSVFADEAEAAKVDGLSMTDQVRAFDVFKTSNGEAIVGNSDKDEAFSINKRPVPAMVGRQSWRPL